MGAVIGRVLAVDSVDLRTAADGKFEKELAATRTQREHRSLSAIEMDYALLQEKTRLEVKSGAWRPFQSPNDRSRWGTVRALRERLL